MYIIMCRCVGTCVLCIVMYGALYCISTGEGGREGGREGREAGRQAGRGGGGR